MSGKNRFYDKQWPDNYEELVTYYPRFYRDVREMDAILHAHGRIADKLEDSIERAYLNAFIDHFEEWRVKLLEDFLNIPYDATLTLDERRAVIKSFTIGFGHLSATALKQIIMTMLGAESDIVFEPIKGDPEGNNALYIDIKMNDDITGKVSTLIKLFKRKIPAHIVFFLFQWILFEIDHRDKEKFILQKILFKMGFNFFGGVIYNSEVDYGGWITYNQRRRYGLRLSTRQTAGVIYLTEDVHLNRIVFFPKVYEPEEEFKYKTVYNVRMAFWNQPIYDGVYKYNGDIYYGQNRAIGHERTGVRFAVPVLLKESVGSIGIISESRDCRRYDGNSKFNGVYKFNSVYKKEVIQ